MKEGMNEAREQESKGAREQGSKLGARKQGSKEALSKQASKQASKQEMIRLLVMHTNNWSNIAN